MKDNKGSLGTLKLLSYVFVFSFVVAGVFQNLFPKISNVFINVIFYTSLIYLLSSLFYYVYKYIVDKRNSS